MLDVHPPDHAAHTWRDFLIHIATIVVGLLIAIGLEQSVEFLHHRHELRETREALKREREENIQSYAFNTEGLRNNIASLRNNLLVLVYLHEHPHAKRTELPGVLIWPNFAASMTDIAWRTAQTSNVVALMPRDEVSDNAQLYEELKSLNEVEADSWKATTDAQSFAFRDPDPTHLSQEALEKEIDLLKAALVAKYRVAVEMAGLNRAMHDFKPAPTRQDIINLSLVAPPSDSEKAALAAARAQTDQRMAATPEPKF